MNTEVPRVGVGCIVVSNDLLLMVKNHRGLWSTPGGHLNFGESPAECAARETREETGIAIRNVEFVAISNDVLHDTGRHYLTVWMRADAASTAIEIEDTGEVAQVGWFPPDCLPSPLHLYFRNLIEGRTLPPTPENVPFLDKLRVAASAST